MRRYAQIIASGTFSSEVWKGADELLPKLLVELMGIFLFNAMFV